MGQQDAQTNGVDNLILVSTLLFLRACSNHSATSLGVVENKKKCRGAAALSHKTAAFSNYTCTKRSHCAACSSFSFVALL